MSAEISLQLNIIVFKTYVFGGTQENRNGSLRKNSEAAPSIRVLDEENLTLLGAPVFPDDMPAVLDNHTSALKRTYDKLKVISAHQTFYVLRHCFAIVALTVRSGATHCPGAWHGNVAATQLR